MPITITKHQCVPGGSKPFPDAVPGTLDGVRIVGVLSWCAFGLTATAADAVDIPSVDFDIGEVDLSTLHLYGADTVAVIRY
jgi:hypothetical protein